MKILAIETSCDETAAALVKTGENPVILSNVVASQIDIHRKFGGVFPEHASRAHVEKIIPVVEEALGDRDYDVIAVTTGPGLIGSLLIGVNFAKALAFSKNKKIIGINHWLGHIYSNWAEKPYPQFPALILIVSGGHTGLVLMKSHNEVQALGQTLDDSAGEAFDKVAKLLDLGYPGGPVVAASAEKYCSSEVRTKNFSAGKSASKNKIDIHLPKPMLDSKDYNFSFSGLKTAVLYETKKMKEITPEDKNMIAANFQQTVIDILIGKTIKAAYEFKPKSICLCGGVSANKELRSQMGEAIKKLPFKTTYHVPAFNLSTDNAAMIGIAAAYHGDEATDYKNILADANASLK